MPTACSPGHTLGAEDGDPEKLSQAASAQTSCISYYSARATASCSRMFWVERRCPAIQATKPQRGLGHG